MSTFHQCSSGVHEAEIARLTAEREAAVARAEAAEASELRLRHLLGSHADGHQCTCEMTSPGSHIEPPEWEQDPWCPTHPDMSQVTTAFTAMEKRAKAAEAAVARVEATVDAYEALGFGVVAGDFRAALDGDQ